MTFHAVETRCLWLEFAGGAAGDHGLSDPFSFIRLVDSLIEGGEQQELIASLRGGRWVLAADESIHISHISGLGVFSVHMEQMDGSDASLEMHEDASRWDAVAGGRTPCGSLRRVTQCVDEDRY